MTFTNAKPYSPSTTLTATLGSAATSGTVGNASLAFPVTPCYAVITGADNQNYISEDPDDYETVLINTISTNTISNMVRGVEGNQKEWASGSYIANLFTAEAYKDIISALEWGSL